MKPRARRGAWAGVVEAAGGRPAIDLTREGFDPAGSFKDRGMTTAVPKALESSSRAVIRAPTGNAARPTAVPPSLDAVLEQLGL